jgi:hypothetical protein
MTAISISSALAISTNTVRVTLSSEPQHQDSAADGDALNAGTWVVERLDSDLEFNVIGVAQFDITNFDLLTYEPFGPFLVSHQVSSVSLLAADGTTVISSPTSATFAGVAASALATPEAKAATRRFAVRDISNPPAPAGLDSLAGTLVIGPGGDYVNEEGPALIRKLAIRRLITRPGEFFWAPDYGIGLGEKEPVPANLVALAAEIERQIGQEPEVETARADLTEDASGILTVQVRITLKKTGQQVDVSYAPGVRL